MATLALTDIDPAQDSADTLLRDNSIHRQDVPTENPAQDVDPPSPANRSPESSGDPLAQSFNSTKKGGVSPSALTDGIPHVRTYLKERNAVVYSLFGTSVGACIADFSVSYNRIHGRLYVTKKAILFYSNLFGFERRLCLQFSDIQSIEAFRMTSIRIEMVDCEDYVFKKFADRDRVAVKLKEMLRKTPTFNNAESVFEASQERNMLPSRSRPALLTSQSGLDYTESRLRPHLMSDQTSPPPLDNEGVYSSANSNVVSVRPRAQSVPMLTPRRSPSIVGRRPSSRQSGRMTEEPLSPHSFSLEEDAANEDDTDLMEGIPSLPGEFPSQTSVSRKDWEKAKKPIGEFLVENTTLGSCSLDQFLEIFVADSASHSLAKFQAEEMRDEILQVTKWKPNDQDPGSVPKRERFVQFVHPLKRPAGPYSKATTNRKQQLVLCPPHGIVMENTTHVSGIPAADCFHVVDRWVIEASEDGNLTLSVSFKFIFDKFTMLKSIIQKIMRSEAGRFLEGYISMVNRVLSSSMADDIGNTTLSLTDSENSEPLLNDHVSVVEREESPSMEKFALPSPTFLTIIAGVLVLWLIQTFLTIYLARGLLFELRAIRGHNEQLVSILEKYAAAAVNAGSSNTD